MGEAIGTSTFDRSDEIAFRERLARDLEALPDLLGRPGFGAGPATVGAEVEMILVDRWMRPAHVNLEVLAALDERAGPNSASAELDAFCVELDTPPGALAGAPFADLRREIAEGVAHLGSAARAHACHAAALGTLPTVGLEDLASDRSLTAEARYAALGRRLAEERADDEIAIDGAERLAVRLPSIAIEGVMSALQVHLKVPPERFAATFNAAHVASAPAVALAANSPFVLEASLWPESRIPLFRQVVDGARPRPGRPSRAPLAHGWLRGSPVELFAENVHMYAPLLPARDALQDDGSLHALRLHSGTIWRWNRPVLDPSGDGHLRIELRALPSGPTVDDMVANAAYLLGATLALADRERLSEAMPFAAAEANLLAAARDGLDATLLWPSEDSPSPRPRPVREVCAELLELGGRALRAEGVGAEDLEGALGTVVARLERGTTGAAWQRAVVARHEPELGRRRAIVRMMRALTEIGPLGPPVAEWPV